MQDGMSGGAEIAREAEAAQLSMGQRVAIVRQAIDSGCRFMREIHKATGLDTNRIDRVLRKLRAEGYRYSGKTGWNRPEQP